MYKIVIILGMITSFLEGCGTSGRGLLYVEPSIKRSDVSIKAVAIVPNRLPMNLQDPEKWRRYNWGIVKDEFVNRGFEVVDYETSVRTFEKSGLPVEDTKTSRDKYADLAQGLGVDAIIVPYYGTFASFKNILIFMNNVSYVGVATFQIYLARQNDFFSRIDATGENEYTTGIGTLIGTATTLLSNVIKEKEPDQTYGYGYDQYTVEGAEKTNETLQKMGLYIIIGGAVIDLIQTLRSQDSRWESAFEEGIKVGLKPFFASYLSGR